MSGIFGAVSHKNCSMDVFFGTDYHSHLGTRRAGLAFHGEQGFQRTIHSIETSPFRTRFEKEIPEFEGQMGIGVISDLEPQPVLIRAAWGTFAVVTVGRVNNIEQLANLVMEEGKGHFFELSGGRINQTELVAALIARKHSMEEGIRYAQQLIDGSMAILAMTSDALYAARDIKGRTPLLLGRREDGFCVSFESFAYFNLGYQDYMELGPGEVVRMTPDRVTQLLPPLANSRICSFLWIYFGYPNSSYEGVNVECMRYRFGAIMARDDAVAADCVSGVPDSGTAHAIGYANAVGLPFQRPLIKYTPTWPRSFMPQGQSSRSVIARMKLAPVSELIRGKRLIVVDDSVVRGTQARETMCYLHNSGAAAIHYRAACPAILFPCKYLNFSRSNSFDELIGRRIIAEQTGSLDPAPELMAAYLDHNTPQYASLERRVAELIGVDTMTYQSVAGLEEAIGIGQDRLCTYCMNGQG